MKNRTLMSGLLLLALGCGGDSTGPPLVLQPGDLCSGQPTAVIATFESANLELAVRFALSLGAQTDLTCGLVSGLTTLSAERGGITSLVGIQNLTSLTILELGFNAITDISLLSGLTNLTILFLTDNSITDVSALSGLTGLTALRLHINSITDLGMLRGLTNLALLSLHTNPDLSDIQPLLDNPGLGTGDDVLLQSTNVSCTDVDALRAKGVAVISDCR